MTPYEIDILLWYHCRAEDHPDVSRNPPIWRETIDQFVDDHMIEGAKDCSGMVYAPTERLHAYVRALCLVPLPTSAWVVDWPAPLAVKLGNEWTLAKKE